MSQAHGEVGREEAERRRRRDHDARAGVNTQSARYLAYEGSGQGQEWEHPRNDAESYPAGWTVAHEGRAWASKEASNVDEPGVRAWVDIGLLEPASDVPDGERA